MKKTRHNILIACILIISILIWIWLLQTYGAETIVDYIGAENGYLVIFLVALFGGVSSFTGVTYVATIITLASAGLNPLGVALASGVGVSFGDTAYYYIGKYGLRELASTHFESHLEKFTHWLQTKPKAILFFGVYVYTSFSPFPNDVLAIALGLSRQSLKVTLPALVLGNITFTLLLATLGRNLGL